MQTYLKSVEFGLIAALAIMNLPACSSGNSQSIANVPESDPGNSAPVTNLSESQKAALQAQVTCPISGNCSPAVGMLVTATTEEISACTSFLITPDVAVTNSHCIPMDLKAPGANCAGRVWLNFPETNEFAESRVECARILSASDISAGPGHPDYAFYQLQHKSERPVLQVSRAGFADKGALWLEKVNPTFSYDHVPRGTLERVSCISIYGGGLLKDADHVGATMMTIADCSVIHGNSGSPILDDQNQVRGIIQETIETVPINGWLGSFKIIEAAAQVNGGTSFACINFPQNFDFGSVLGDCNDGKMDDRQKAALSISLAASANKAISASGLDTSDTRWQFAEIPHDQYFSGLGIDNMDSDLAVLVPQCFMDKTPWIKPYRDLFGRYSSMVRANEELPIYKFQGTLNRYLQVGMEIDPRSIDQKAKFIYDANSLAEKGQTTFTVTGNGLLESKPIVPPFSFSACAPEVK